MAHARPNPSYVDVPRPNSSIMMREFSVADLKQIKNINKVNPEILMLRCLSSFKQSLHSAAMAR